MRELSVAEQRYEAVRVVIADGATVTEVAARFGVARKTVHQWLARYEAGGLDGLADRSHWPRGCPHQMPARVEVALVELGLALTVEPWPPPDDSIMKEPRPVGSARGVLVFIGVVLAGLVAGFLLLLRLLGDA